MKSERARKPVDRFVPTDGPKEIARTVVGEGAGTKLADIPNVVFKLDKLKGSAELLEDLHVVLFKTKGKLQTRKKDVKSFSGFVFEEDAKEGELEKVSAKLNRFTLSHLHDFMDVLDLPRGDGSKESKVERVVAFLNKPAVVSEKNLAEQAAKKKDKAAKDKAKKEKAAEKAAPKKAAEPAAKKGSAKKATPAKGKAEKATPTAKTAEKKKGGKATPAAKKATPAAGKKRKADEEEEKPAKRAKKGKEAEGDESAPKPKWPPAKDLTADVEFIFKTGVESGGEMTMGKIYSQLAEKYGMTVEEVKTKKATIKNITNKYTERQEAGAADEADAEAADGAEAAADEAEATAEEPKAAAADQEQPTVEEPSESEAPKPEEAVEAEAMDTDAPAEEGGAEPMETEEEKPVEAQGAGEAVEGDAPAEEDKPLIEEPATTEGDEFAGEDVPAEAEVATADATAPPAEPEVAAPQPEAPAKEPTPGPPATSAAPPAPVDPPKQLSPAPAAEAVIQDEVMTEAPQAAPAAPPAEEPTVSGKRADSEDAIFGGLEDLP